MQTLAPIACAEYGCLSAHLVLSSVRVHVGNTAKWQIKWHRLAFASATRHARRGLQKSMEYVCSGLL